MHIGIFGVDSVVEDSEKEVDGISDVGDHGGTKSYQEVLKMTDLKCHQSS